MRKLITSAFALLGCFVLYAQDLPDIVPLSPNAASIAKYGEVPVGHFTGVPNIGIPIYTVSSGELSLPLSLSYHAGGHKVETVASWVGLGWNLGSIPTLSRIVRGLPDEVGFYTKYQGTYTTTYLSGQNVSQQLFDDYRTDLHDGSDDSEPDIFNYSIPGESGKFFWSQEKEKFLTYPKSNIKITRNGSGYTLVDQNGVEYIFFGAYDQNTNNQSVINSWYASTMVSANKKDSIRFTYRQENQHTKTKNVSIKYHFLGGSTAAGLPSNDGSILNNNLIYAKLPDSVIFSNGYVKFNVNATADRQDLNGGHKLENISIYNNHNQLVSKHEFTYRFKTGNGASGVGSACYNADSYSTKWMLLDKVDQVSINSSDKLTHNFTYNESYFPACRYSAAQDYWGYYNGYDTNKDLIPSHFIVSTSNQIIGADRSVNTTKSDYGILTKITYPTGGYTEFDYENNVAYNDDLLPEYTTKSKGLFGDDYQDVNGNIPLTSSYFESAEFTINNSSDPVLNNNNLQGGATLTTTIEFPGCDISTLASTCALMKIIGTGTTVYSKDLNQSQTPFYIPNGTYKLTASFDTSVNPDYDDFIFIAEWNEIAPNQTGNKYVGGLRVKEIRSYANATATPITKKYKYTTGLNTTTSSGDIFGTPNFSHSQVIAFYKFTDEDTSTQALLQRVSSTSNVQQISHSGSFVGYKKVFEETSDIDETGYTEYEFSHKMDEELTLSNKFPYPPTETAEIHRGLLLHQKLHKKVSSGFEMVQRKSMEYTSTTFDNDTAIAKYTLGIKWGMLSILEGPGGRAFNPELHRAQMLTPYHIVSDWKNVSKETNVSYHENDSITSVTNYFYDNSDHLLRTRTEITDSRRDTLKTVISYADEMNNVALINENRVAIPLKTEMFNGAIKLSTQETTYGLFSGNNMPLNIKASKGTASLENRITFHSYYSNGRVKEVSKVDGTHIVYIWGYNEDLPIAKIENATFTDIPTSVYNDVLAKSDLDTNATGENNLRTALATLRNHANLSNAMVTTYTYDPLVGVTSITDPRGNVVYYEYDGFNRLKQVKDVDGNILSHNKYNYKD